MTYDDILELIVKAEKNILSEYITDPIEKQRRIDVCSNCELKKQIFTIDYCADCTCIIRLKANSKYQSCPFGYWELNNGVNTEISEGIIDDNKS